MVREEEENERGDVVQDRERGRRKRREDGERFEDSGEPEGLGGSRGEVGDWRRETKRRERGDATRRVRREKRKEENEMGKNERKLTAILERRISSQKSRFSIHEGDSVDSKSLNEERKDVELELNSFLFSLPPSLRSLAPPSS